MFSFYSDGIYKSRCGQLHQQVNNIGEIFVVLHLYVHLYALPLRFTAELLMVLKIVASIFSTMETNVQVTVE